MNPLAFFYPDGHAAHFEIGHPERPERVEAIKQALEGSQLWGSFLQLEPIEVNDEILGWAHSHSYLKFLYDVCEHGSHIDGDTYTTPASWQLALNAAGGGIAVASAVWEREANVGFALTRPPGHHAMKSRGMGFCLMNNIAIVAHYLIHLKKASRLAIIDYDLHHGNGTQDIFWDRGDVLFISTHQSPLYPGTGLMSETGIGEGEGKTANFPLPPGSGDQAFLSITGDIIIPLLNRHVPEMILVSYGFDPHWRDPLGHLQLSARGYAETISLLHQWSKGKCDGKIALFLEGGYDIEAASACSLSIISCLMGEPWEDTLGNAPRPEGFSWQSVVKRGKELWKI